jgi:hypothetical protein
MIFATHLDQSLTSPAKLCISMADHAFASASSWTPDDKIMKNLLDSRQEVRKEGGQAIERKVIEMLRNHQDVQIKQLA